MPQPRAPPRRIPRSNYTAVTWSRHTVTRAFPWSGRQPLGEATVRRVLPKVERRIRHPGRKRHPDRLVFQGILFVLHTGIAWEHLPQELGFGSGMTCWRRLAEWR